MATQLAEADDTPLAANDEARTEGRDFETEARVQGWRPQDEFNGDPAKWADAETFVKNGEHSVGIQKKTIAAMAKKISIMEGTIKKLTRAEQSAYASAVADLKAKQEEAVEAGDIAAFKALDGRIDKLRENAESELPATRHGEDAAEQFDTFRDANPWFDRANLASATDIEKDARIWADKLAERMVRQGLDKQLAPSDFFERVAEETVAQFPQLKARREKPASDVGGVTRPGGSRTAKTGANLPAEAKAQAERFMAQGIFKVKTKAEAYERYAASYDWS